VAEQVVEAGKQKRGRGDLVPPLGDFLSRDEAAALLRKAPATIDALRKSKRWRRGVHWFKPKGSAPLYSRKALETWVREGAPQPIPGVAQPHRGCPLNEELID